MNIEKFAILSDILNLTEIDKVERLAFFHAKLSGIEEFYMQDICIWFEMLGLSKPNTSRLQKKISESKRLIKGKSKNSFKLHLRTIQTLESEFPQINDTREEIETIDSILPRGLYENTRGYIESLAKQINSSYENNIFDGCAVLMRRLMEILLILAHEAISIESEIKDNNGEYKSLIQIISNSILSKKLGLSRNTKECLDTFRKTGNFSAHKIYYNAKRKDIKDIALDYRATIEELLYKAKILK